jgi:uncharacterized protein
MAYGRIREFSPLADASTRDFQSRSRDVNPNAVKRIPPSLLDEAVKRLKKEFQPVEIYLFGSHAWGTPHDDSDVDIMVIVSESSERPIKRMQRAHHCLGDLDMSKDVFVQTRTEFDRPSLHSSTLGLCESYGLPRSRPACARRPKKNGSPGWR